MKDLAIFGAKSIALGCYYAIKRLYTEYDVKCFLVSKEENNPKKLAGLDVIKVEDFKYKDAKIIIAVPEDMHNEIIECLKENDINDYVCLTSDKESKVMEMYYGKKGIFKSLHSLKAGDKNVSLDVYSAKFYKDKKMVNDVDLPRYISEIQVGASLTDKRICGIADNIGDNISAKNVNFCELTALYWVWKNKLCDNQNNIEYYGLFHYRRILDISENDVLRLKENDIDAVLPFPTVYEPNIKEHHARYIKEKDWEAMLKALKELEPEYYKEYEHIFSQEYLYNYNIIVAKKDVLKKYCEWLFPILFRAEELSEPRGCERADRYIGYLGENLLTLYFIYNKEKLKIMHTGRIMLT